MHVEHGRRQTVVSASRLILVIKLTSSTWWEALVKALPCTSKPPLHTKESGP